MILNIFMLITGFAVMEFVAWSNHKYVMHGFLWRWHKDHHVRDRQKVTQSDLAKTEGNRFEKNDLFFIVYATPAIVLMIVGITLQIMPVLFLSIGITLYGMTYFLIHDVAIHQRLNIPWLLNSKNHYLQAIIRAHIAHHRPKKKTDFYNYGLLLFPKKFLNE